MNCVDFAKLSDQRTRPLAIERKLLEIGAMTRMIPLCMFMCMCMRYRRATSGEEEVGEPVARSDAVLRRFGGARHVVLQNVHGATAPLLSVRLDRSR